MLNIGPPFLFVLLPVVKRPGPGPPDVAGALAESGYDQH